MNNEMREEAQEMVISGIDKCTGQDGVDFQAAGKFIKESMDRRFGPAWHCIIGEAFSFEINRQLNSTLLMYYGGTHSILLFKC